MDLRAASDAGQPVTARDPDGMLGLIYRQIARAMMAGLTSHARAARPHRS
jgi:ATP-binding protein involved in chromosome partitioning